MSDINVKTISENDGELAVRIGGREVYRSANSLLGNQESRVHSFAIVNVPPIFSVDLKVNPAARAVAFRETNYLKHVETSKRPSMGLSGERGS